MKKTKNLEKGIKDIINYIEESRNSQHANEPNAYGLQIMLQDLLEK